MGVIKIDHICFACTEGRERDLIGNLQKYKLVFQERNLKNLTIKNERMHIKVEKHDLFYFEADNHVPIEITSYEKTYLGKGGFQYNYDANEILWKSDSIKETIDFFNLCGAKFSDITEKTAKGKLKGILDRSPLNIQIEEDSRARAWYLDEWGGCCLALIVKDSVQEWSRIGKYYMVSEIKELNVNNRHIYIFFAWRDNGEIIEFISSK